MNPAAEGKPGTDDVVILDTNVLLADPNSLLSFPRAEVVIPETVLGELDKLKTARVDPDLRFRGREVSRLLFELSEEGSLTGGVELPDGGSLRVAPVDSEGPTPAGLTTRNTDDRILATAWQIFDAENNGRTVTLVTNDLNMLLKAQTLGIPVRRHGEGVEGGFARRYIIRPFQRYKVPIGILAIALAVFAAIIVIAFYTQGRSTGLTSLPDEFRQILAADQQEAFRALTVLQRSDTDSESLLTMGNYFFGRTEIARQSAGNEAQAITFARQGIGYYERYLQQQPESLDPRADMASLLFYTGQTDRAIQEVGTVLEGNPDHVNANFNLGIFYWQGRRDLAAARAQMNKVIELIGGNTDPAIHAIEQQARALLKQIDADIKASAAGTATTEGTAQ